MKGDLSQSVWVDNLQYFMREQKCPLSLSYHFGLQLLYAECKCNSVAVIVTPYKHLLHKLLHRVRSNCSLHQSLHSKWDKEVSTLWTARPQIKRGKSSIYYIFICVFGQKDVNWEQLVFPQHATLVSTVRSVYLCHSTVAKKGWDLISSTPPTPAPSLSVGLYWSSCTGGARWKPKRKIN